MRTRIYIDTRILYIVILRRVYIRRGERFAENYTDAVKPLPRDPLTFGTIYMHLSRETAVTVARITYIVSYIICIRLK